MILLTCNKCGGGGRNLDGNICDCSAGNELRGNSFDYTKTDIGLIIPKDYINIQFDDEFCTDKILSRSLVNILKNKTDRSLLILSEQSTGKAIFLYSYIKKCIEDGLKICPMLTTLDIQTASDSIKKRVSLKYSDNVDIEADELINNDLVVFRLKYPPSKYDMISLMEIVSLRASRDKITIITLSYGIKPFTEYYEKAILNMIKDTVVIVGGK